LFFCDNNEKEFKISILIVARGNIRENWANHLTIKAAINRFRVIYPIPFSTHMEITNYQKNKREARLENSIGFLSGIGFS
jgi:hypothetical protein